MRRVERSSEVNGRAMQGAAASACPGSCKMRARYEVYLLYWCKSTNTELQVLAGADARSEPGSKYEVYLLYWYISTNIDT
jgi:hypothetical protein